MRAGRPAQLSASSDKRIKKFFKIKLIITSIFFCVDLPRSFGCTATQHQGTLPPEEQTKDRKCETFSDKDIKLLFCF